MKKRRKNSSSHSSVKKISFTEPSLKKALTVKINNQIINDKVANRTSSITKRNQISGRSTDTIGVRALNGPLMPRGSDWHTSVESHLSDL